jgi:hypothetical protein
MTERGRRIGQGALALILFVSGLLLAYLAFGSLRMRASTQGRIDGIRTQKVDEVPSRTMVPQSHDVYWTGYTYEVGGRPYWSEVSDIRFDGEIVTVYYDPDNPRRSRLGKPTSPLLLVLLASLSVLGGALAAGKARAPRPEISPA